MKDDVDSVNAERFEGETETELGASTEELLADLGGDT